jgi:predicted small lipoprotein YifL
MKKPIYPFCHRAECPKSAVSDPLGTPFRDHLSCEFACNGNGIIDSARSVAGLAPGPGIGRPPALCYHAPMRFQNTMRLMASLVALSLMPACGLKGPLVLPKTQPAPEAAPARTPGAQH